MKAIINKSYIFSIYLLMLGLASGPAFAQGGCPPGQAPRQFGQVIGCAPTGIEATLPPPQIIGWKDNWGAIADNGGSVYGVAENMPSEDEAAEAALEDCKARGGETKGKECALDRAYRNGCAAILAGERTSSVGYDVKKRLAIKRAKKICRESNAKCIVYYSACNEAIPIYSR